MIRYIMMGPSGAGKTTWARNNLLPFVFHVSADHYFYSPAGEYVFHPAKLAHAHGECLREFVLAVRSRSAVVVVDNTNCTIAEVAPYMALALAYRYEVRPVMCGLRRDGREWYVNVEQLTERNVHGVPRATVERQAYNLIKTVSDWPAYWPAVQEAGV